MKKESRLILLLFSVADQVLKRGEWYFVEFLLLATCRTFRFSDFLVPLYPGAPTKRSIKEPEAEGPVGRLLCNLPAISHGHCEGQNGQMGESMWKAFEKCNTCETLAAVGINVPRRGCQQAPQSLTDPPAVTHMAFPSGCYSPMHGPTQALVPFDLTCEKVWSQVGCLLAAPCWIILKEQPCLLHLWIPRI